MSGEKRQGRKGGTGIIGLVLCLVLAACGPRWIEPGPPVTAPRLATEAIVMADGAELPLRRWEAEGRPRAVIFALHGFNDYGNGFALPAAHWAEAGITTLAMDQRGFGGAPDPGRWPAGDTLVSDAAAAVQAVADAYPDRPLFLLGESMGGAVSILASTGHRLPIDGMILVSPAAWGGETMNPLQRASLWLTARLFPGWVLTGAGLDIRPSDNIDMLRAMGADPLVIKGSRTDTLDGLVRLMGEALEAAHGVSVPTLVLFGAREEVLTEGSVNGVLARLPETGVRLAVYPDGHHMLLRDLAGEIPARDVAAWIGDRAAPLPSGAETGDRRVAFRERE